MGVPTEIAKKLLQIKAIKLSPQKPFTWASGMQSPIYCDNRIALSFPEVRNYIIDAFVSNSQAYEGVTAIAGVATAGIAHGALLADRLSLPFAYVRSKAKAHGRQNLIEGQLEKGAKVLVVEDLISTGGSSLQAVNALREYGVEVLGTLAIFTYGFAKATDAFAQAACPLTTLTNYGILIEQALEDQYISENELELLKKWREAPQSWHPA